MENSNTATTQKFSRGEAIRFGWETMKNNLGFFIVILITGGLIYFVPDIIEGLLSAKDSIILTTIGIASWVLSVVILMGLIKISLKFCDNEKTEFTDLFCCFPLFFKYLFGSTLYRLTVLVGMILLIIPGIIWAIKFQFYGYFIVDKGLGPIEALKRSSEITKGAKWDLFVFNSLLLLINLLGAICLFIGLFATIPTTIIATAFVYRRLLSQIELSYASKIG